jgi:3-phosphoshikimate 1-carboxyvinyltransferase
MAALRVTPSRTPLRGLLAAPPDPATAELAAALAALAAPGARSELAARGLARLPIVAALTELGVEVAESPRGVTVIGRGRRLHPASRPIDVGGSPMAAAVMAALLAGQPFASTLAMQRPLARAAARVARPIRQRGGQIEGELHAERPDALYPPLFISPPAGGARLSALEYEVGLGDAAGKTAALVSGLFADGVTDIHESLVVSDRSERLLAAAGASLRALGPFLALEPPAPEDELAPLAGELAASGDAAALLLAAGALVQGSTVGVSNALWSASRAALFEGLVDAGFGLAVEPRGESLGEALAQVVMGGARAARGLSFAGERALRAGVALPTLAVFALAAEHGSESEICDLPEDEVHPERATATLDLVQRFGIRAELGPGRFALAAGPLRACHVDARGDGAVAMAAALLALAADGPCRISAAEGIVATFPRFVGSLRALGARIEVAS